MTDRRTWALLCRQMLTVRRLIVAGCMVTSAVLLGACGKQADTTLMTRSGGLPTTQVLSSPGGDTIAMSGLSYASNSFSIYVADGISRTPRPLFKETHGNALLNSWTPTGEELVFYVTGSPTMREGSWIVRVDGQTAPRYLRGDSLLAWSASGKLALSHWDKAKRASTLSVESLGEAAPSTIFVAKEGAISAARWTPDEAQLAFLVSRSDDRNSLYVHSFATQETAQLVADEPLNSLSWSPDGQLTAYTLFRSGENPGGDTLHVMRADGSCDRRVPGTGNVWWVDWGADLNHLVYVGADDAVYRLDLAARLGKDLQQLSMWCA